MNAALSESQRGGSISQYLAAAAQAMSNSLAMNSSPIYDSNGNMVGCGVIVDSNSSYTNDAVEAAQRQTANSPTNNGQNNAAATVVYSNIRYQDSNGKWVEVQDSGGVAGTSVSAANSGEGAGGASAEGGALDTAGRVGGGLGAVVGAAENLQNGATGVWLGKNGKLYPSSWGGNGSTGGRLAFAGKIADVAHTAGNVVGVVGVGISVVQGYQAYSAHNTYGMVQSGADVGMGVAGFFGPIGWALSSGYFVGQTIDHYTGATDAFAKWYTGYP